MLSVAALASGVTRYLLPLLVKKNKDTKHEGTSAGDKNTIGELKSVRGTASTVVGIV